jgi:hypothetical protein
VRCAGRQRHQAATLASVGADILLLSRAPYCRLSKARIWLSPWSATSTNTPGGEQAAAPMQAELHAFVWGGV